MYPYEDYDSGCPAIREVWVSCNRSHQRTRLSRQAYDYQWYKESVSSVDLRKKQSLVKPKSVFDLLIDAFATFRKSRTSSADTAANAFDGIRQTIRMTARTRDTIHFFICLLSFSSNPRRRSAGRGPREAYPET